MQITHISYTCSIPGTGNKECITAQAVFPDNDSTQLAANILELKTQVDNAVKSIGHENNVKHPYDGN